MTNPLRSALADVRVADFSINVAGPSGTMILADLGADVVKVERPRSGDDARAFAPMWAGESTSFLSWNRNKRSIELDLKSAEGLETARRLALKCDVLVESFRPGVMEKLGLGYESLQREHPGLVYCSVSAFGQEDTGRRLAGYDTLVQAFTGLMLMTGEPGGKPARVSPSIADISAGLWLANAVMGALHLRRVTGRGVHVSISLLDSLMFVLGHQATTYLATGDLPERLGTASALAAPYQAIATRDGNVIIAAGNDDLFVRLTAVLGQPTLREDPRFASMEGRIRNRSALIDSIEALTRLEDSQYWIIAMTDAGIPCGPVNDLGQAIGHPLISGRNVIATLSDHPTLPEIRVVDSPLRVDGESMSPHSAPPTLGQHNSEILDWLGDGRVGATSSKRDSLRPVAPVRQAPAGR